MKTDVKKKVVLQKTQKKVTAEALLENSFVRAGTLANQNTHLFVILDSKKIVVSANKLFCSFFKQKNKDIDGVQFFTLMDSYFSSKELRRVLAVMLTDKRSFFQGLEVTKENKKIGQKSLLISGRWVHSDLENEPTMLLLSMEDMTGLMNIADIFASKLKAIPSK